MMISVLTIYPFTPVCRVAISHKIDYYYYLFFIKMPQFVTKMTKDEMALESKKATIEGMKNLIRMFPDSESESESDSESTKKLERQIHYMKLDMGNLKVDLNDANERLSELQDEINIFKKIDDGLANLYNLKFYLRNLNNLTVKQLKNKIIQFDEEENELIQNCRVNISKIKLTFIKESLSANLAYKKKENYLIKREIIYTLNMKWFVEQLMLCSFISCFILMLVLVEKNWTVLALTG